MTRRSNPFATRYISAGAIPFEFSGDDSIASLVAKLTANQGWGQIIGPHGSGKTSLVSALLPHCQQAGWQVVSLALHDGAYRLPISGREVADWGRGTLVVIDGYEQLVWWARLRLKRWCRRKQAGLLITAHQDCGLPWLYRTFTDLTLFRRLVHQRLRSAGNHPLTFSDDLLENVFQRHNGNVREAFLSLYDHVSDQRRSSPEA